VGVKKKEKVTVGKPEISNRGSNLTTFQIMYAPRIAPSGTARVVKRTKYAPRPKRKRTVGVPPQVRLGRQALPKQLMNTVVYCETVQRTMTAGVASQYQFSCNGLFDPNITGTGRQPMYFDQLSALYNHYTVLRSRISVTWASNVAYQSPLNCTLYIEDDTDSGPSAAADQAAERPTARTKMFVPTANGTCVLYNSWDAAKTFGPNPQGNSQLIGTSSANPSEQSYFTIVTFGPALDSATLSIRVRIEYDVVWDELTTIAAS